MTFAGRIEQHNAYTGHIIGLLHSYGLRPIATGVESLFERQAISQFLHLRHDPVSRLIRFFPDYVVRIGAKFIPFDIKSPSKEHTNIAVELEALAVYRLLESLHIQTFLVVSEERACWVQDVRFKYIDKNPGGTRGSNTPYGLVDEVMTNLVSLPKFIATLRSGK